MALIRVDYRSEARQRSVPLQVILLEQDRTIRTMLEDAGFNVIHEEGPGNRDWDFWDAYIKKGHRLAASGYAEIKKHRDV